MSSTLSIRLEPELKNRLEQLAGATARSKSFLAAEAIRDFINLNEWQIQEIAEALNEAGKGDFASKQSIKNTFSKWGVDAS